MMMSQKNPLGNAWRIAAGLAAVLATSALMGASPLIFADEPVVYYACKSNITGRLRIVEEGTSCRRYETRISWNQEGEQGETGAEGPAGPQGVAGLDGNTVLHGEGIPTSNNPVDPLLGDFYVDISTWCIYGPLTDDGWGTGHPLQSNATCEPGDPTKIVFVTSRTYNGDLGGVAGADEKCAIQAFFAGLDGEFKAWISDANQSPEARFSRSGGPYMLPDGTKVAEDWDDLTTNDLDHPINKGPEGNTVTAFLEAWTNTDRTGATILSSISETCANYTSGLVTYLSLYGLITATTAVWTSGGIAGRNCNTHARLYCFQQ